LGPARIFKPLFVDVGAPGALPREARLDQNYPNPFNGTSTIGYQVASSGIVRLAVYDLLGREVVVLVNERREPGHYTVRWEAGSHPSGVYLCRMVAGGFTASTRVILMK
jgi:hypothetical protein